MGYNYFPPRSRSEDKRLSEIQAARRTKLFARVWTARLSRHMTQRELADFAGISVKTVSCIERGRRWPTVLVALKLAKVLDRPVEELFTLEK